MRRLAAAVSTILLSVGSAAHAQGERSDVPIKQIVLPSGNIRYSVPVVVGNAPPIDAALDTGSFGLRVLGAFVQPGQYQATDVRRGRTFEAGVRLNGFIANAPVKIGASASEQPVRIQVIDKVDCTEARPQCPASRMKPADYRIAGDGYAGRGLGAILGISLRQAPVADAPQNPLLANGDTSWIVVLPRPGSSVPGHLIINPTDEDRAGFSSVPLQRQDRGGGAPGWADGALAGCLVDEHSNERTCGKTLLDTGGPGISADSEAASGRARWKSGVQGVLEIQGGDQPISVRFTAGDDPAHRVVVHPPRNASVMRISAGTLPYFYYAVLYDAKSGTMGFKPRGPDEH